jgi:hypothetical protein
MYSICAFFLVNFLKEVGDEELIGDLFVELLHEFSKFKKMNIVGAKENQMEEEEEITIRCESSPKSISSAQREKPQEPHKQSISYAFLQSFKWVF